MASPYADPPAIIVERLRDICTALPEVQEQKAWAGTRWQVRRRTFAHVLDVDRDDRSYTVVTFRSDGPELDALFASGHPFYRAGWGRNVVAMVLDDGTDWDEVSELMTESYCILAPQKLVATVARPAED